MKAPRAVREMIVQEEEVPNLAFQNKVRRARCPRCRTKGRLLVGPFYNRGSLVCCECGHKVRVKVKI